MNKEQYEKTIAEATRALRELGDYHRRQGEYKEAAVCYGALWRLSTLPYLQKTFKEIK